MVLCQVCGSVSALAHLVSNLLRSCDWALHPWMSDDVSDVVSVLWVVLEHRSDKVFEVLREEVLRLELLMSEPEPCSSIVADEFVEVVSPISALHEGRAATHHDEQNDGTCEQVDFCPIVVLSGKDLRCHVSYCSDIA